MIDFHVITLDSQAIFVSGIKTCLVLLIHWIKLLPFNIPCAPVLVLLPSLHFLLVITVMLCAIVRPSGRVFLIRVRFLHAACAARLCYFASACVTFAVSTSHRFLCTCSQCVLASQVTFEVGIKHIFIQTTSDLSPRSCLKLYNDKFLCNKPASVLPSPPLQSGYGALSGVT